MVVDLIRPPKLEKTALQPPDHPAPFSEIMFPRNVGLTWVSTQKIVSFGGQAFTSEQHHFVRYLESGLDALASFYRIHRPTSVLQFTFINETFPDQLPIKGLDFPWRHVDLTQTVALNRTPELFGPVSDQELFVEAHRLDSLQRSIIKKGFLRKHGEGWGRMPISGHVLLHTNGDFRIIILSGNHRVAVLVHCGWKLVPIVIWGRADIEPPVRLSDLEEWPGVVDGRFTPQTARAIFEAFFRPRHEKLLPGW